MQNEPRPLSNWKHLIHVILLFLIALTRNKYLIKINNKIAGKKRTMDIVYINSGLTMGSPEMAEKRSLKEYEREGAVNAAPAIYLNPNSWDFMNAFLKFNLNLFRLRHVLNKPLNIRKLFKTFIYVLPKEMREEFLGDIEEIHITLKKQGHSDLWIKFICFINTFTVFLAALRIRILDLFNND